MWSRRRALATDLPHWTKHPAVPVVLAAGLAVLVRVPRVGALAYPDEGGALLVVRQWQTEGPGLYGPLEVDRPPLLMAFWRVAAALGGVEQARWLVCPLVATLVLAAGWAGWLIGDAEARGGRRSLSPVWPPPR
ncbi:MAG: hypothetical protein H0V23_13200 [Nocardioidaceae bacterium]|nr:hypothetical protein [Nocardioidaceae bacterium]